ncbi:alpha-N-acetylgalactosaminidase [Adhaeribacter aerolatus]|uniref:Alpha-N-acetylgalactosaminidase n=1 Tax=Adhaeribacter aerolatus TaxID=670289 RepID=A0A512B3F2_9BACT|nr:Gfo/Idh/MocA family oxidoreductase [Adhaeribacter aerolatus]GEO06481.1 alpha-N-acetylgalactosaminidase [Adhaeribacter aerolatus]
MSNYDRRDFLKLSSAALGGLALSGLALPQGTLAQTAPANKPVRLGFIGIGGRGSFHLDSALGIEGVEVPALCEIIPARLERAAAWVKESGRPAARLYGKGPTDYLRLISEEKLDAVICCTPWDSHAAICLAAMRNNKHAVSEVPIVLTVDQAWEIVETYEKTGKWATIGLEGFGEMAVLNMIQKGMLGDIIHAETGYIHDLRRVKFDPEEEPWRLQHALDRNGNLYPDHPMNKMMPALDINHGDRFDFLVSMSSKSVMINDYAAKQFGKDSKYAKAKVKLGDYNATLIRTVNGKMITLNHDTHTPHPRENYRVQGTKGVYMGDKGSKRIYIEGVSPKEHEWEPAEKYLAEHEHPLLKNYNPPPRKGGATRGHGSRSTQTPIVWHRLVAALRENKMPDWDVYDSVTSSAISPLTEASVASKSRPVDFPDFTKGKWKQRKPMTFV